MSQFDRSRFDHIGVVTDVKQPGESWVAATRVWVTSPRAHPYNVEFVRFEPDSPITGPLRTESHVAYRLRVRTEGRDYLVEQQAYYRTDGPRITWMRVLCSGYQPVGDEGLPAVGGAGPR